MKSKRTEHRPVLSVFFLIVALCVLAAVIAISPYMLVALAGVAAAGLFIWRPMLGLYSMAVFALLHRFEIPGRLLFGPLQPPALFVEIHAPVVAFLAIVTGAAFAVAVLLRFSSFSFARAMDWLRIIWPYFLFLTIAALSALIGSAVWRTEQLWYVLWPMAFVGIGYTLLPAMIVDRHEQIRRLTALMAVTGGVVAIYGLSSLFVGGGDWWRVTPYSLFGFAPYGNNHNILAEALVLVLPLSLFHALHARAKMRRVFVVMAVTIAAALFLTLSRAAWLAVLAQGLLVFFAYRTRVTQWWRTHRDRLTPWAIALFVPVFLYMLAFLFSPTVSSSNTARIVMNDIALTYALQHPIIGYGPGMFVEILSQTYSYTLQFGQAVDAHGIIQKIVVEMGILGLAAFLGFVGWIARAVVRSYKQVSTHRRLLLALSAAVVGELVFQLFNTSYYQSILWFPLGLLLSLVIIRDHTARYAEK